MRDSRHDRRRARWAIAPWVATWTVGASLAVLVPVGCHRMHDGEIDGYRCQVPDAYGPPACPEGLTCVAGTCTDVGVPFGFPCDDDTVCPPDSACLDPADFGADGEKRCSRLCCGSVDCGPPEDGMVCRIGEDTTASFCWPAKELDRPTPGKRRAGDDCSTNADCRSAVCAGGRCEGACCGDSYCAAGSVCRVRLTELAEREVFACGASGGPMDNGLCNSDDDCASGLCVDANDTLKICATPCCSSNECVEVLVATNMPRPVACDSDGTLRACSRIMGAGATGQVGSPCVDGDDCRSGLCLDNDGDRVCSDSCCDDASCGDPSAFACVPVQEGETWALRCVPK